MEVTIKKSTVYFVLCLLAIPVLVFGARIYFHHKEAVYSHNMEVMEKCREMYGKGNAANECIKTLKK